MQSTVVGNIISFHKATSRDKKMSPMLKALRSLTSVMRPWYSCTLLWATSSCHIRFQESASDGSSVFVCILCIDWLCIDCFLFMFNDIKAVCFFTLGVILLRNCLFVLELRRMGQVPFPSLARNFHSQRICCKSKMWKRFFREIAVGFSISARAGFRKSTSGTLPTSTYLF